MFLELKIIQKICRQCAKVEIHPSQGAQKANFSGAQERKIQEEKYIDNRLIYFNTINKHIIVHQLSRRIAQAVTALARMRSQERENL